MAQKMNESPHFVIAELCKLVCRIVKIGWFDINSKEEYVMRDVVEKISQFIQVYISRYVA